MSEENDYRFDIIDPAGHVTYGINEYDETTAKRHANEIACDLATEHFRVVVQKGPPPAKAANIGQP